MVLNFKLAIAKKGYCRTYIEWGPGILPLTPLVAQSELDALDGE